MKHATLLGLATGLLLPMAVQAQWFPGLKPKVEPQPIGVAEPMPKGVAKLHYDSTPPKKYLGKFPEAEIDQQFNLDTVNRKLGGRLVDYTQNHGLDKRILSKALMERRDLYVYLPPGYVPTGYYPLVIYMHGVFSDEKEFAQKVAPALDQAILNGDMPPLIVAAPDGSLDGNPIRFDPGSFFINGPAGDFQDYVIQDVWSFVTSRYNVRPEPEAHILAGASMGGYGAFNTAIKYRNDFRTVVGVMPALNLRWMNTQGNYHANFDPFDWGWRNSAYDPEEVLASYFAGLLKVKVKDLIYPVFGAGPNGVMLASWENPVEMIDRCHLRPGELAMYIAYCGQDEFNLDAQAESFLYMAKSRGVTCSVYYDQDGDHSEATALKMMPHAFKWIGKRLRQCGLDQTLFPPCNGCHGGEAPIMVVPGTAEPSTPVLVPMPAAPAVAK